MLPFVYGNGPKIYLIQFSVGIAVAFVIELSFYQSGFLFNERCKNYGAVSKWVVGEDTGHGWNSVS
jgi:hypothetical protein